MSFAIRIYACIIINQNFSWTKVLEKLFTNILHEGQLIVGNPMYPKLTTTQIDAVSSVLSIVIHGDQISWVRVLRNKEGNSDNLNLHVQSMRTVKYLSKSKQHFLSSLLEVKRHIIFSLIDF